jgi:hypothetical protein
MDKRIVFVLLAALLLGVVWLCWPRDGATLVTAGTASPTATVANAVSATAAESAAAAREAQATRTPAATPAEANDTGAKETGELLVRVVWADGTKAPGIHVYLARSVPGASRPLAELVSDAAGEARARVATGRVLVTSDRGHGEKELVVEVTAGLQQEVVLTLPAGLEVAGIVHDAAGGPVGGASIWLTGFQSPWCAGAFVASADAHGAFALRGVPKGQSLGAVAAGYAPSKLVDLDLVDTTQKPVRIELVLSEPGGAMTGRVTDEQGKAVAGAIVAVGTSERRMQHRSGNSVEEVWTPRRAVTDADGHYAIEGLQPGAQRVEVWGPAFAFWHGQVTIVAHEQVHLDVTLLLPVTVFGTVTAEDGKPLAGACVRCFPIAIETPFLQGGQYDYESTFGYPFAIADAEGRYRLFGAASPDLHLYAGPGGYRNSNDTVCWDDAVLHAEPGATVEWNAKIDPGLQVRGVVRYHDGLPMAGVFITLVEPGAKNSQTLVNDKQGRFRFVRLQKKAYDVSVQVWDPPKGAPPLEAREVWPDTGEVEIVATFDAPKKQVSGSVRGSIVDAAGCLVNRGALAVILASDHGSWWTQSNLEGTSFHFKGIEPGRMRVIAMSGEDPILYGPWIDLGPAEQRDVGALVTEPGGRLVLRVVRQPGTEALEPTCFLTPTSASHGRKAVLGKGTAELTFDHLVIGEYRIAAYGKGMASIHGEPCTVTAGAEATATITLRAAAERDLVVEYEAAQRLTHIRVQDDRGREVFDHAQPRALDRPYRVRLPLPIGRFTFLVETEGGKAETPFEMASLAPDQPAVVLRAK